MRMSNHEFTDEFRKMVRLCGFTVNKDTPDFYYDKLKFEDYSTLVSAFTQIIDDPPNKLTLKAIRSFINIAKNKDSDGNMNRWNGTECGECENGLIHTKHFGYDFVWRCMACKSYDAVYPFYTGENVAYLEAKLKNQGYTNAEEKRDPEPIKTDIKSILQTTIKE